MTDELAQLEQRGCAERRQARQARKAAKREPEAVDKRLKGRRARRRGRDFERVVAAYLGGELVPGSGAYGGGGPYYGAAKLKGDVILRVGDLELQIQCKRTRALQTQRRWLEADGSDLLVQADPGERVDNALVVMRAETLVRLLAAINSGGGEQNG